MERGRIPRGKLTGGRGVDVVLDPVGGDRFLDSLRSLAEGGRVIVVGFTGGSIPEVKVNRLLLGNTSVVGAGWGAYVMSKPDVTQAIGAELSKLIDAQGSSGRSSRQRFPLEQAGEALGVLSTGARRTARSCWTSRRPPVAGGSRGFRYACQPARSAPTASRIAASAEAGRIITTSSATSPSSP